MMTLLENVRACGGDDGHPTAPMPRTDAVPVQPKEEEGLIVFQYQCDSTDTKVRSSHPVLLLDTVVQ